MICMQQGGMGQGQGQRQRQGQGMMNQGKGQRQGRGDQAAIQPSIQPGAQASGCSRLLTATCLMAAQGTHTSALGVRTTQRSANRASCCLPLQAMTGRRQ